MITVNKKLLEFGSYPNRESIVPTDFMKDLDKDAKVLVEFKYAGDCPDQDLLRLLFILGHLAINGYHYKLIIHYMPYSRMDRSQNGSCFSLLHICKAIGSFVTSLDSVYVVEPHSAETLKNLRLFSSGTVNAVSIVARGLASRILQENPDIAVICYPDKGARERFTHDFKNVETIYAEKVRDFDTGEIKGLDIISDTDLTGKSVLILDDLCVKGGTFYYTAEELRKRGATAIFLGVCHLEFAVENGEIIKADSSVNKIYATDTMLTPSARQVLEAHEKVHLYSIEDFSAYKEVEELLQ